MAKSQDSNLVEFSNKKQSSDITGKIREFPDRFEYQFIDEYEEKYDNFQADSIPIGGVWPQLFTFADRTPLLVSVDFFKTDYTLDEAVAWLEKHNIVLGRKDSEEVVIKDAYEVVEGLKFFGLPVVVYVRGSKRITVDTGDYPELTEKFISQEFHVDPGEAKKVQSGLTIVYNDEVIDKIPLIELDMSRDLVFCNGTVIAADFIGEFNNCLSFFRDDVPEAIAVILEKDTTIYIDEYECAETGAKTVIIKYQYLIDVENL